MLFMVAVHNPFLLDNDQCGVVEAGSMPDAIAQVRMWVAEQLDETADDYTLREMVAIERSDQSEIVVKTESAEGQMGEDTVVIRPVESPLMFLAEDWASVFD